MDTQQVLAAHGVGGGKYRKGSTIKRADVTFLATRKREVQLDTQNISQRFWIAYDKVNKKVYSVSFRTGVKKIDEATGAIDWATPASNYTGMTDCNGNNAAVDSDGNLYFAVWKNSKSYLLKVSKVDGSVMWEKVQVQTAASQFGLVFADPATGYIWMNYGQYADVYDKNGTLIRSYNSTIIGWYCVAVDEANDRIFIGTSLSMYAYCRKISDASPVWSYSYGQNTETSAIDFDATACYFTYPSYGRVTKVDRVSGVKAWELQPGGWCYYCQMNKYRDRLYAFHNGYDVTVIDSGGRMEKLNLGGIPLSSSVSNGYATGIFVKENEDFFFTGNQYLAMWEQGYKIR